MFDLISLNENKNPSYKAAVFLCAAQSFATSAIAEKFFSFFYLSSGEE